MVYLIPIVDVNSSSISHTNHIIFHKPFGSHIPAPETLAKRFTPLEQMLGLWR